MAKSSNDLKEKLKARGVSRRDFLKYCTVMAGALALESTMVPKIAHALETKKRPPVIWLEFQDCAGCSESFLRATRPPVEEVILDTLSVDYHETLMAAAGYLAEEAKEKTIKAGKYLLIVEGAIPTGENGIYCAIGGKTAVNILKETAKNASAIITVGNCASFGGLPKAAPNPTKAVGVMDIIKDKPIINLPGCPVNAVNITATIVYYLTFNRLPKVDALKRPLFAYGYRVHDNCERRAHFDKGEFVHEWGDKGHRNGWCLYKMGCKGPATFANCPRVRWNYQTNWPVGSGHGCIGCTEPDFWELGAYNEVNIPEIIPPTTYPPAQRVKKEVPSSSKEILGGLIGAAVGGAIAVGLTKGGEKISDKQKE